MTPLPSPWDWRITAGAPQPVVLHPGLGDGWWGPGPRAASFADRLWWRARGAGWVPLPWPDPRVVQATADSVEAWLGERGRHVRADASGWREVARTSTVPGPADAWISEGFVYARRPTVRAVDVVAAGTRWQSGPGGVLLGGDAELVVRGAADLGAPIRLPAALRWPTVRVGSSGRVVAGVDAQGRAVRIELAQGRLTAQGDGDRPISAAHRLSSDGRLLEGSRVRARGLREASPAGWGDRLAGPRGVVWSLTSGTPLFREPAIALGVTVGTPHGFVTIDWETHGGCTVDASTGARSCPFTLPLSSEDTVAAGIWADGAVHVQSALGARYRVIEGRVEAGDRAVAAPVGATLALPEGGGIEVAGAAVVEGRRFGWTEDGWLLAVPVS